MDGAEGLSDPVALARALVRVPSVTPDQGAALGVAEQWLRGLGFATRHLRYGL